MREEEFERLYAEHAPPLLNFLLYRTGDLAVAEDVLSDTFERVFVARRRFDPRRASEKTWVYSIALNRLRDHMRRQAAELRALEAVAHDAGDHTAGTGTLEDRDLVLRALRELSDDHREAIALRYGADMTIPSMAKVLKLPRTTVEKRLSRALAQLRNHLT